MASSAWAELADPTIAHSTVKVLDRLGVGIFLPENQGCCGIPALSSGDLPTFHKLLAHNLKRFEAGDFDVLVTACATCTSTIHEVWPKMADDCSRASATRLAQRTMDINQFLIDEAGLATYRERMAFHLASTEVDAGYEMVQPVRLVVARRR